jgi:hypothetical protein
VPAPPGRCDRGPRPRGGRSRSGRRLTTPVGDVRRPARARRGSPVSSWLLRALPPAAATRALRVDASARSGRGRASRRPGDRTAQRHRHVPQQLGDLVQAPPGVREDVPQPMRRHSPRQPCPPRARRQQSVDRFRTHRCAKRLAEQVDEHDVAVLRTRDPQTLELVGVEGPRGRRSRSLVPAGEGSARGAWDQHGFGSRGRRRRRPPRRSSRIASSSDRPLRSREASSVSRSRQRHAEHWQQALRAAGREPRPGRRPWRSRLLGRLARWFGVDRVLPAIIRAEAADRDRYRTRASPAAQGAATWSCSPGSPGSSPGRGRWPRASGSACARSGSSASTS